MSQLIPIEKIQERIFMLRGQKVMLNTHLAELYGIETRVLMQAVKRNADRFPPDFMFVLTRQEIRRISQIVTSLKYSKVVFVFTEQGVAMLSSVLHSPRAIQINHPRSKLRGIVLSCQRTLASISWIPAFAGMTTQASGY
ncbi:MAG: ORF6N domain-containing protein [Bacteroidota bacterium]